MAWDALFGTWNELARSGDLGFGRVRRSEKEWLIRHGFPTPAAGLASELFRGLKTNTQWHLTR